MSIMIPILQIGWKKLNNLISLFECTDSTPSEQSIAESKIYILEKMGKNVFQVMMKFGLMKIRLKQVIYMNYIIYPP